MNKDKLEVLKRLAQTVVGEGIGGNYHALDEDKFAELIVQECIEIIEELDNNSGDEYDVAIRAAIHSLKKEFGVE